jgi:IclR family KDG regulon transcriptional repressor
MKKQGEKISIYRVQSLERAIDILECFSYQKREMSLSEIVGQTGLNRTTVKRLVSNLESRGLLQQDPDSKNYRLGLLLFSLGGIVLASFSLRKVAAHPMFRLQNVAGVTTLLGIIEGDHLVVVAKREGDESVPVSSHVGLIKPLPHTMLGRVLMAYLLPKDMDRVLREYPLQTYTPYSITDKDAFGLLLAMIQNQGYGIERQEFVEGIMGIAAPIRDYSRKVIAALGVALPASKGDQQLEIDRIVSLLLEACEEISVNMGYLKV